MVDEREGYESFQRFEQFRVLTLQIAKEIEIGTLDMEREREREPVRERR